MKPEWIIFAMMVIALCVVACKSEFADKVSCGLIHKTAMEQGVYCYQYGDAYYCTKVVRKPVHPARPMK